MLQSEVIQPLESTRNKIKEQLSTVQEYRLLVALEKCISQIPDISNDTMTTLERVKEKLKECLQEVRDYRALRAIEETIVEVHNILAEAPSAVQPLAAESTSIETAPAAAKAVLDGEALAGVPDADTERVA
jgi:predicted  nucleic acid-binding Zn-ribbon protein